MDYGVLILTIRLYVVPVCCTFGPRLQMNRYVTLISL